MVNVAVPDLKRKLLEEVRSLFRRDGSAWKEPILDVLDDLRQSNVSAVLFGGTLRSLLVSRVLYGKPGRPRDVDVVVSGVALSQLEDRFRDILTRKTRFGGLQLRRGPWQFDVWPVNETWAFRNGYAGTSDFSNLPSTTTFNLEAVAVEVWPHDGRSRAIFSGNDQFFEGILSRTLELNREETPFPELTVVRSIVLASDLQFMIGPRLANFIRSVRPSLDDRVLEEIQIKHYGHVRMDVRRLMEFISIVAERSIDRRPFKLPIMGQLHLWESTQHDSVPRLNVHWLGPTSAEETNPRPRRAAIQ